MFAAVIGRYLLEAIGPPPTPTKCCFTRVYCPGSLLHILIEVRLSAGWHLCTPPFPLQKHHSTLANCHFATLFTAPKLAGLRLLGRIESEGQRNSLLKNGLYEVNCLATGGCQREVMFWYNCRACRPHLEKAIGMQ